MYGSSCKSQWKRDFIALSSPWKPKESLGVYSVMHLLGDASQDLKFRAPEIFIILRRHKWVQFKCSLGVQRFEGSLCSCCRKGPALSTRTVVVWVVFAGSTPWKSSVTSWCCSSSHATIDLLMQRCPKAFLGYWTQNAHPGRQERGTWGDVDALVSHILWSLLNQSSSIANVILWGG